MGIGDRTRIIRRLNNGQISVQRVKVLSKIIFFAIYTYISTMTRKKRCENELEISLRVESIVASRFGNSARFLKKKKKNRLCFATSFIIFPLFHGLGSRLRTDGWIFQRG